MILIFRHVEVEGPGYLAEFLERRGLAYRLVCIDAGDAVPTTLDGVTALVFMGGSMSVNDPLPWVDAELALIRAALDRGLPVLGHCLGAQLMAKALGAPVTRNRSTEIGWFPIQRSARIGQASLQQALPAEFTAFHWHGETFALPAGAERLYANAECDNQAFVYGNSLALQCHIEMTAAMVAEWARRFADQLHSDQPTVMDAPALLQDLDDRIAELQRVADAVYTWWTRPLQKQDQAC